MMTPRTQPLSGSFWATRREASLNWLALGMLLAAWNASSNEPASNEAANGQRRPDALRGYTSVSVRAMSRVADP